MTDLIKPKEVEIKDLDGMSKSFVISRLPAIDARKMIAMYPVSNMPKIGDYQSSEEAMLLLLKYVEVTGSNGEPIRLATKALVDSHVNDAIQLITLEYQMLEYNTNFFGTGSSQGFLNYMVTSLAALLTPTLTNLSEQLSQVATSLIQNSGNQSTWKKPSTSGKSQQRTK